MHFGTDTLTLCFLMDFPIHIDIISIGLSIVYFEGSQLECIYDVYRSLKAVLPKYLFNRGFACWERAGRLALVCDA